MSGGLDMARGWLMTGQKAKGKEYIEAVWKNASQYLNYYLSLPNDRFLQAEHDCIRQIMIMLSWQRGQNAGRQSVKNRKKFGVAKHDTKLFIIHINLFYPCS